METLNTIQYYKLRAKPRGFDRYNLFMDQNFVAAGWPSAGANNEGLAGMDFESIKEDLRIAYARDNYSEKRLGLTAGILFHLANFQPGDRILIPREKEITFAIVTGPYRYDPKYSNVDCAHQVPIKKIGVIPVSKMSDDLKKSLDSYRTLSSLEPYKNEIEYLLGKLLANTPTFKPTKHDKQLTTGLTYTASVNGHAVKLIIDANISDADLDWFITSVQKKRLSQT